MPQIDPYLASVFEKIRRHAEILTANPSPENSRDGANDREAAGENPQSQKQKAKVRYRRSVYNSRTINSDTDTPSNSRFEEAGNQLSTYEDIIRRAGELTAAIEDYEKVLDQLWSCGYVLQDGELFPHVDFQEPNPQNTLTEIGSQVAVDENKLLTPMAVVVQDDKVRAELDVQPLGRENGGDFGPQPPNYALLQQLPPLPDYDQPPPPSDGFGEDARSQEEPPVPTPESGKLLQYFE